MKKIICVVGMLCFVGSACTMKPKYRDTKYHYTMDHRNGPLQLLLEGKYRRWSGEKLRNKMAENRWVWDNSNTIIHYFLSRDHGPLICHTVYVDKIPRAMKRENVELFIDLYQAGRAEEDDYKRILRRGVEIAIERSIVMDGFKYTETFSFAKSKRGKLNIEARLKIAVISRKDKNSELLFDIRLGGSRKCKVDLLEHSALGSFYVERNKDGFSYDAYMGETTIFEGRCLKTSLKSLRVEALLGH